MDWLSYTCIASMLLFLVGTVSLELADRLPEPKRERIVHNRPLQLGMQALFFLLLVCGLLRILA